MKIKSRPCVSTTSAFCSFLPFINKYHKGNSKATAPRIIYFSNVSHTTNILQVQNRLPGNRPHVGGSFSDKLTHSVCKLQEHSRGQLSALSLRNSESWRGGVWWAPGTCSVRDWVKRSQKKTWAGLTSRRKLGPNFRCTVAREKGKGWHGFVHFVSLCIP